MLAHSAPRAVDTMVIGSGPGGLTAAVALARAGQRVLVVEQHYLPGGWTHSFSLDGHQFSPGVHYIGDLGPGGGLRRVYESLDLTEDLEFTELNPDGFDHVLIEGERFDQPKGLAPWKARLAARFPADARGLERFFDVIEALARDVARCDELLSFPRVLALPVLAPRLVRHGFSTLGALLERTIKNPMLRAVLSAQCGNHGLPPARVSLPLHAGMTAHYFGGAFYPRGGAKRISAAYIKALRRRGGEILLDCPATRIVTASGRAVGVELRGERVVACDRVVCNADPAVTYGKLLPRELCPREAAKVERTTYSVAMMSLFCAVRMDLRAMGLDSGNWWLYRTRDIDGVYERAARRVPDPLEALFLTVTSLKDPGHEAPGTHTIELFTFVPYHAFARWEGRALRDRGPEYDRFKDALAEAMLDAAEEIIPGLRRNLIFRAAGTPLTNVYYCASHLGAMYGAAKTPWQLGPFAFRARGPVDGLHMCGASILCHGVAGATMSGLIAARDALSLSRMSDLVGPGDGSLRITPADSIAAPSRPARDASHAA